MSFVGDLIVEPAQKKKRGRRSKTNPMEGVSTASLLAPTTQPNITDNNYIPNVEGLFEEYDEPTLKKRGRKPKGGKLIIRQFTDEMEKPSITNVILHLKCSLSDLSDYTSKINKLVTNPNQYNPEIPPDIQAYNSLQSDNLNMFNISTISLSETIEENTTKNNTIVNTHYPLSNVNMNSVGSISDNNSNTHTNNHNSMHVVDNDVDTKDANIREINHKLKKLKIDLYKNNNQDKKSACFWCTYDFDNPPVYIPKHFIKETYHVYGCFCSPECATAYLMDENIDSSSKFERYHLMNHIYSKIYDYKKNIKPAPNPYYMLEKYYGNLSIQEYRSLLRNERLFLIVDKPLTRILPELHEDNDDFIINNKIIPSNTYQIKKKLQKKQTKSTILSERFGLTQ